MGCDIHSVAQVFKDGRWTTVLRDVIGDPRNYDTFAMLANVRNGTGFAGCLTGDAIEPIDNPRGLPDDFIVRDEMHVTAGVPTGDTYDWIEDEAKRKERLADLIKEPEMWMGDHSFSWLLLSEIDAYISYMSGRSRKTYGVIAESEYLKLRNKMNMEPDSWCGAVSGPDVVTMSAAEYEKRGPVTGKQTYVQYEWRKPIVDCGYIKEIRDELTRLAVAHNVSHDAVRMVFGFDS